MIYVPMPSLQDDELEPTILEVLNKASSPDDIVFGIRFLTNYKMDVPFFLNLKNKYNIRGDVHFLTEDNAKDYIGIGKCRIGTASYYDGEEFVLSIDSHTMLAENWDIKLKEHLWDAQELTGNNKVIITMQGGSYRYTPQGKEFISKHKFPHMGYDKDWSYEKSPMLVRPLYDVMLPWSFSELDETQPDYLPIPKFSYHAAFSDEMFLYDEDEKIDALEDDILKTFKLYNDGWELVFPNVDECLIAHLYFPDINEHGGGRAFSYHYMSDEERLRRQGVEKENALRYLNDPSLFYTIEKYKDWLGIDFGKEIFHNNYIPERWFHAEI